MGTRTRSLCKDLRVLLQGTNEYRWWRLEPTNKILPRQNDSHKAKELCLLYHPIILSIIHFALIFSISHNLNCSCKISTLNTYSSKGFTTPNSTLVKQRKKQNVLSTNRKIFLLSHHTVQTLFLPLQVQYKPPD